ncbi:unnamed protein product [Wuchereria bancrofti]|uniref:Uncharacterized protein n=1 Tax=Wuchereria bancrofti TaxID=6293 RepID=A0A3P7E1L7_WUCBA|nr:unnamed protein product [Wuchereria bancrofti]
MAKMTALRRIRRPKDLPVIQLDLGDDDTNSFIDIAANNNAATSLTFPSAKTSSDERTQRTERLFHSMQ